MTKTKQTTDYRTTDNETMRDYTKIEAWKPADDFTVAVYQATQSFPRGEIHGLTSQLRRASYSVPANIAEGSARDGKKDYLHFLYISRASLSEAQYFVHLSRRLGYLPDAAAERLIEKTRRTFACLHGLIKAVEKESGELLPAPLPCLRACWSSAFHPPVRCQ